MKSAAMKTTHTNFISHNIYLFYSRLMTEPLWEETERKYVHLCEDLHS